uniref:Sphingomyelin phosphodiesterase n=1 Tax=Eimeria tenella TaxID=5802 RepID=H9B993_EIMTE|nr:hypothetical protein [Eimeria tenella]
MLYNIWRPALPQDPITRESFLRGMYYSTYLKAAPQVLICGHIMPALTVKLDARAFFRVNWEPEYASRYRDLVSAYSDVVLAQLFGHQHEGTLTTLLPRGTQPWNAAASAGPRCNPRQPNLPTALLSSPSVSPKDGNNPAVRVLVFDRFQDEQEQTWAYALGDYAQYRLPLYGFVGRSGFGRTDPVFEFESSFQDTFRPFLRCAKPRQLPWSDSSEEQETNSSPGCSRCIDGSVSLQIADAIRRSPFAYAAYQNHRYAGGRDVASGAISCSSLATTEEEFLRCIDEMP